MARCGPIECFSHCPKVIGGKKGASRRAIPLQPDVTDIGSGNSMVFRGKPSMAPERLVCISKHGRFVTVCSHIIFIISYQCLIGLLFLSFIRHSR
ncbi:hypothetical protein ASPWEDRAFT_242655 [Aspergillus wentii DTO 134E9]|uniref:Uncharacterized protein n=1 Tax=Aspergillus wentii DTO 134E9 TaxID=1073089 RepID=A0A1L9S1N5_ASPWE|nr:uncharacterized protein ASPWEDRAFT_242655 [Aspergillus wentii DTO 134E9]OJJ41064.1 hypothetical protein ASPWEDRAFT_242655 [Aspergillus wentii DTO 134E9]